MRKRYLELLDFTRKTLAKNFSKLYLCKQKEPPEIPETLDFTRKNKRARDGIRTRGPHLGKVVLHP